MAQQHSTYSACFLSCAIPILKLLIEVAGNRSLPSDYRRVVSQIATHLGLTHDTLESVPIYWIEPDVEDLCRIVLNGFARMICWPQPWRSTGSPDAIDTLFSNFAFRPGDRKKINFILTFFKVSNNKNLIDDINNQCSDLYKLIENTNDGESGNLPTNFNPRSKDYLIDFDRDLFNALEIHIKCGPNAPDLLNDHKREKWHPARLCLAEEEHSNPSISLLISPMQMAHWQDFHLVIHSEDNTAVDCSSSPLPPFCDLIDTQQFARVEIGFNPSKGHFQLHTSKLLEPEPGPGRGENLVDVLSEFQLTAKDKVILAYTIAQAYHHFYDSDLMRIKWTSEAIWFMPPAVGNDEIPLRPYLIFPFGTRKDPEEDFIDNAMLVHRHPRILAIGVLLLEIGLSKPFQSIPQRNSIAQVNRDHLIAHNWLKDLKTVKWEGFTHKSYFDKAVEYCIREGRLLVDTQNSIRPVGAATNSSSNALPDKQQGILARRKKFYKNVVLPLKWLAEKGFRHHIGSKLCIRRNPRADSTDAELPYGLSQPEASFHSGRSVNPAMWLRDLNLIGITVERLRRTYRIKTAVRVAIIDTGIQDMDSSNTSRRIKHRRDFVGELTMTDSFGHGTLMARLITDCAPSAEIIIARVAKNTKDLEISQENIKDAILWAGIECQADIISMSFGFPKDHESIDNAIRAVQSQRKEDVIFLASAGNSPSEDEIFPARHPFVIPIYAANCRGTFMETNPRLRDGASAVWATYGGDIPDDHYTDIREKYPNICQPGSSVATAVAAGISATMMAYADLLPYLEASVKTNCGLSQLMLLRRKSGMEALFKSMARRNGDSRQWFIDPISFWRDTSDQNPSKHFSRYSSIYSCLQDVSSKLPR